MYWSKKSHNQSQITYYSQKIKSRMTPQDTPYIQRQLHEVLKLAEIKESDRVLEVGCGMGRCTIPLAQRGIAIEGLELTPFLLDQLREINNSQFDIPLYCADITEFPEELTNQFDVILGFFVLHHFYDLDASFNAMYDLLKASGKIVFLEPNAFNPLYYIQVLVTPTMSWKGDKGIVNMRKKVISKAMAAAGFQNFESRRYGFFPPAISNKKVGRKIEAALEKIPVLDPVLPFQLFKAVKQAH